jgi:hypothetical protein
MENFAIFFSGKLIQCRWTVEIFLKFTQKIPLVSEKFSAENSNVKNDCALLWRKMTALFTYGWLSWMICCRFWFRFDHLHKFSFIRYWKSWAAACYRWSRKAFDINQSNKEKLICINKITARERLIEHTKKNKGKWWCNSKFQ